MSAGSKARRSGDPHTASHAVVRRGLEIFGLAFLFRLQAWLLGGGSLRGLLKVDILNIMGPSIMGAAALWGAARTDRARLVLFGGVTVAIAMLTPVLRSAPFIIALPEPVEAYFRPVPGLTNFVLLPWAAFVTAGAFAGVLLDTVVPGKEARLNSLLAVAGLSIAALSLALSYLPGPYAASFFWTTSPAFFFLRTGVMVAAIAAAYAWESRPGSAEKWSPVRQLGRTSLFIYWIHVEMVYGLISQPLHRALSLGQACAAYALFAAFMLGCSVAKDRAVAAWRRSRIRAMTPWTLKS